MVEVDTVLLKVASRCNIDCRYCYVYNMGDTSWARLPKRMAPQTCRATAAALARLAEHQRRPFAVVLHGGEPLLLGATGLQHLISLLRDALRHDFPISIQTNGILIDRQILDLCARTRVTLSVSLDGPRHVHDRNRVDFTDAGTFDRVLSGVRQLRSHSDSQFLFSGLLAVIDPCSDPHEVYHFFKDLGPPSIDFIYRDGNHSRLPVGKSSPKTTEYGRWLATLLDIYLSDDTPIPIRILDDMIKLVLGGHGSKDGAGLTNYTLITIDTDGSLTKNDTLKSAFDGADRFSRSWSVHTHHIADLLSSEEFAHYIEAQRPTSPTCLDCPELRVCGGGMTLQRWRDDNGYDNPSVYCADQQHLISHIRKSLASAGVVP